MVCSDEGFEDYQGDLLVSMGGKDAAGTLLEGGRGSRSQNLLDSGHQDFGTLLSLSTSTGFTTRGFQGQDMEASRACLNTS